MSFAGLDLRYELKFCVDFSSSEYAVKAKHARSGLIWDDKLSLVRQIYPIKTRLSPTRAGSVGQEVDTISLIQPFLCYDNRNIYTLKRSLYFYEYRNFFGKKEK